MGSCSAPPSDRNNQTAGAAGAGASKFLANLPSRGLFSSTVPSSNLGGMRIYICDHNTLPQEEQVIKTNSTNILIRSLMLKKHKGDSSTNDAKGAPSNQGARKRTAEKELGALAKRATTSTKAGARQEGSRSSVPERDLHSLTVDRLRAMLREKGLPTKGKKDELVTRLKG